MKQIAFTFAGQGAQYTGMALELYERYSIVREAFREAGDALGRDARTLCALPQELLDLTENTQIALVVMEVAICRLLESRGIHVSAMAGFSIGEWSALICSGALTLETGIKLVAARAQAMQNAVPLGAGGMLAVLGLKEAEVLDLCAQADGELWPANYNCPGQIVCAGTAQAIQKAVEWAAEKEVMIKKLAMSIPSHCPLMTPAVEVLTPLITEAEFRKAKCPIVCNVDAAPTEDPETLRQNILRQLTSPVLYESSMRTLQALGVEVFIEIGPGKVLTGLAKRTVSDIVRLRVEDERTLCAALAALGE